MNDLETVRAAVLRVLERLERLAEQTRPRLSNFERGARWRRHQSELRNLPGLEITPPQSGQPAQMTFSPAPPVAPPPLSAALEKWVQLENDPRREPVPAVSRKRRVPPVEAAGLVKARLARAKNLGKTQPDGLRQVELLFEDDAPAKRKWGAYREEWREWQKREAPRRAAEAARTQLSELLPAARGDDDAGEPLEVVIGMGLARLRPECNCAVAEIPAEMWAEESGAIVIRPRGTPLLALPHFAESPARIIVAEALSDALQSAENINPFHPEFLAPVLKAAREHLTANARLADLHIPGEEMPAELTLHSSWYVAARPREDASVLKKIIGEFRAEVGKAKSVADIPDLLLRAAYGAKGGEESDSTFAETPDSTLFSCNPEQAEILARMANPATAGAAVLSPSGSGATRTLAGLAGQTLARGGRMLAVSRERERLADLQNALPDSLRRLAAAPLYGEAENRRQIAAAARELARLAAETDAEKLESELNRDEELRRQLRDGIAALEAKRAERAERHFSPVDPMFAEILPRPALAELAKWAAENAEQFAWFVDRPETREFPPEMEDLQAARSALGSHLSRPRRAAMKSTPGNSPNKAAGVANNGAGVEEGEIEGAVNGGIEGGSGSGGDSVWVLEHPDRAPELDIPLEPEPDELIPENAREAAEKMRADRKEAEKTGWVGGLLNSFLSDADCAPSYRRCRAELRILALRRKRSGGARHPDLTAVLTPSALKALRRKANPLLFWLPVRDNRTRKILDGFRMEGRRPRNLADWRKALAFVKWLQDFGEFARRWNREAAADIGDDSARVPESASSHPSWARKTDEALRKMESALRCAEFLRAEAFRIADGVERAGAPQWAAALRTPKPAALPENWQDAWRWGCARALLDSPSESVGGAEDDLREKRADLTALESRLCERRALLAAARMARPEWAQATAEDAENILPQLPLVLAPTWRANEWIPARFGVFDLTAADGGASSPAAELTLLLRGKQAIVFGDDRRYAPAVFGEELGGSGETGIDFLRASDSLYDFARRAWPENFGFLREAYGSAWPLAEMVSRLFYDGKLSPVCFPEAGERVGAPLIAVWTRSGVLDGGKNEREALALADEMGRIFADPCAAARSLGLAALSQEQAEFARGLAANRFGEAALSARDFLCDDADGWGSGGGKKRDIVLASLADSPGRGDGPVSPAARRRLNLALSAARLQLRLAHSVSRDDLRDSSDLRRELLGRFYARGADKVGDDVSDFDRDLRDKLRAWGYAAHLGVGASGLRPGVVVEGENGARLAAELESGVDMNEWRGIQLRRAALMRGGWRFWRAFAADYVLHPERVLADLRARLDESGIHPRRDGGKEAESQPIPTAETRVYDEL